MTVSLDRWFIRPVRRPAARVQLFCLPYAGAGASVFHGWPAAFGPDVEVMAVQLPGRESRMGEALKIDPVEVGAVIAAAADRPYAIFGHSMGGRIAFDVVRTLRRAGRPLPVRLYPSASRPPDVAFDGPFHGISRVDDDELIARVVAGGGVPAAVLDEPGLLELFLPVLRADFAWIDGYEYVEEPPLPISLMAFVGDADPIADQMAGWRRHTSASCAVHTLPGGHFFLQAQLAPLARIIEADLLAAATVEPP